MISGKALAKQSRHFYRVAKGQLFVFFVVYHISQLINEALIRALTISFFYEKSSRILITSLQSSYPIFNGTREVAAIHEQEESSMPSGE